MTPEGLITTESRLDAPGTIARLEAALGAKGVTLFAKIDHAAGAAAAGLPLGPVTVLIFGNAQAGTRLMQIDPRMGIDLPLKVLVWTDAAGKTFVSYNDPIWVAARYGIKPEDTAVLAGMQGLLAGLATG